MSGNNSIISQKSKVSLKPTERYSKKQLIKTHDFGFHADVLLIYRVLSEKSA